MPIVTRGLGSPNANLSSFGLGLFESALILQILDSEHLHLSDEVSVFLRHLLTALDSGHEHLSDEVVALLKYVVNILDSDQDHTSDEIDLLLKFAMQIANSEHDHISDEFAVFAAYAVQILDSEHIHLSDDALLFLVYAIYVADSDQDHFADLVDMLVRNKKRIQGGTKNISYRASGSSTISASGDSKTETTKRIDTKDSTHSTSIKTDLKRKR